MYKILNVSESATNEEIKKAYYRLAMKYHPDKVAYLGDEQKYIAEQKFKEINEAYELIKELRGIR